MKYLKEFLHRGMLFGGFGPVILGIIYAILEATVKDFFLGGKEVLFGIISTYLLAFLQAGASVFNQIEEWPISRSLLAHFATIYLAYIGCYLVNSWIPFKIEILIIFTFIFVIGYFLIWVSVYLILKAVSKRLNGKIKERSSC